jgi:hypothetical protein
MLNDALYPRREAQLSGDVCKRGLARMLLSFLSCLFKYPKRIKRDPFAGLIAPINAPGTGDRTAQPSSLLILAI